MLSGEEAALEREWVVLQGNTEQYERNALLVKLCAVVVFTAAVLFSLAEHLTAWLLAVLWIQEAVLRTFQARIGARLLRIEAALRAGAGQAMQLHSEWAAERGGPARMLREYASAAARPTVAFPYAVLLLVDLLYLAGASVPPGAAT